MGRTIALCASVLLLGSLISCAAEPPKAAPIDLAVVRQQIADFNQRFSTAVAAGDTTTIATMYAADAKMLPANQPRSDGRDAIRSSWAQTLSDTNFTATFTTSDVMVPESGELAIETGTYQVSFTGPGGALGGDQGKYASVFRKEDGEWKLVVDIFNSDAPLGQP